MWKQALMLACLVSALMLGAGMFARAQAPGRQADEEASALASTSQGHELRSEIDQAEKMWAEAWANGLTRAP